MSDLPIGEGLFPAQGSYKFTHKIEKLRPLGNSVIVRDMSFTGRTLSSGIVLLGDDAKTSGIRPRWAKVYAVGPDQKDISEGQWIMVEHGRWTRGVTIKDHTGDEYEVRRVETKSIKIGRAHV